mmetsp:Transcript_51328/g.104445  ORF Transcript_51328/g.104445 Transcript_51328/m.104445 type:complete len:386 (+) Transcript_51328:2741-3898(+)
MSLLSSLLPLPQPLRPTLELFLHILALHRREHIGILQERVRVGEAAEGQGVVVWHKLLPKLGETNLDLGLVKLAGCEQARDKVRRQPPVASNALEHRPLLHRVHRARDNALGRLGVLELLEDRRVEPGVRQRIPAQDDGEDLLGFLAHERVLVHAHARHHIQQLFHRPVLCEGPHVHALREQGIRAQLQQAPCVRAAHALVPEPVHALVVGARLLESVVLAPRPLGRQEERHQTQQRLERHHVGVVRHGMPLARSHQQLPQPRPHLRPKLCVLKHDGREQPDTPIFLLVLLVLGVLPRCPERCLHLCRREERPSSPDARCDASKRHTQRRRSSGSVRHLRLCLPEPRRNELPCSLLAGRRGDTECDFRRGRDARGGAQGPEVFDV